MVGKNKDGRMTKSIPVSEIEKLLERWRKEAEFMGGPNDHTSDKAISVSIRECANELEQLIKDKK